MVLFHTKWYSTWSETRWWLNHQSEKYDIVKLDHFPDFQGEKAKKYLQKPPPSQNLDLLKMSRTSSLKWWFSVDLPWYFLREEIPSKKQFQVQKLVTDKPYRVISEL